MGPYCRYCYRRCFVERVVPDGPQKGWRGLMATCRRGAEHDRKSTGGYDHANSINPHQPRRRLDADAFDEMGEQ